MSRVEEAALLDPQFFAGMDKTEVDEVFITSLLDEMDDYFTAYTIQNAFLLYPGLDTWEKLNDKTWECIGRMMDAGLIICEAENVGGQCITFFELNKYKPEVYEIMMNHLTGDNFMDKYLFSITDKGETFLAERLPLYQPIFDEMGRICQEEREKGRQASAHEPDVGSSGMIETYEQARRLIEQYTTPDTDNPSRIRQNRTVTSDQELDAIINKLTGNNRENP